MSGLSLRPWLGLTVAWLAYASYEHHDQLPSLMQRDWWPAIEYGVNDFLCRSTNSIVCRDLGVWPWQRAELSETFALALTFIGVPAALMALSLLAAWVTAGMKLLVLCVVALALLAAASGFGPLHP
jgi:hypothetical protein